MKANYIVAVIMFCGFAVAPFAGAAQWDGSFENWNHGSSDLQQKIAALGAVADPGVAMPVLFGVGVKDIFPNFGVVRASGNTHEGEDIMAVKGTPIVSPTAAVVTRVTTGGSQGNAVYTANPGGETFIYYHLDRAGEGVVSGLVLARGSLIGYVGNTGDASGGAAHLHFEIRKGNLATDPFIRLTSEFSPEEKMAYLAKILTQATDPAALAQFLVLNFRSSFLAAIARGATVPAIVSGFLASIPDTAPVGAGTLPAGDLALGSFGAKVVTLQKFLIKTNAGSAAKNLSFAGATGYFGALTKAALIEYQTVKNITPANGYYGPSTQILVEVKEEPSVTPLPVPTPSTPGAVVVIMRDLYFGMSGEDVRSLQKILNRNGFTVAISGPGSLGSETVYFGPATRAAVIKYQAAHGINTTGNVGILTRASIATLPN